MSRKEEGKALRGGPMKYAQIMKALFILLSILILPAAMVLTAVACNLEGIPRIVYSVVVAAAVLLWLTAYGFYALRVSMGTVLGIECTDKVVHLHTKRKIFTYDVRMGCVAVRVKGNRYICTFETQDSRDKFTFYRHAPFSKYSDAQFTEDDILSFCPAFEGEDYAKERGAR